ncbi:unnamed protein product [Auanema sp. JU1783]|nr:unnamed protein product [Auanema sp. JU1783]
MSSDTVDYDWSILFSRSEFILELELRNRYFGFEEIEMLMNKDAIFKKLSFGTKQHSKPKKAEEKLTLQVLPEDVKNELKELEKKIAAVNDGSNKKKKNIKKKRTENEIVIITKNQNSEMSESEIVEDKDKITEKYNKKIAELRRLNRIYYWGDDIPNPILEFEDVQNIPEGTLQLLQTIGITDPSPIQMQAIPLMLQRRDTLCCAPTGSGKTLAFVLPILIDIIQFKKTEKTCPNALLAIVLAPTRELASQTHKQFIKFGSTADISYALFEDNEMPKNVNVIVSTPNRLVHSLDNADLSHLRWLIVDESDRLFEVDEGEARCFRTQLGGIYTACKNGKCVNAFFSATYSGHVENWCKENIPHFASVCIGIRNSSNASVHQKLVYTGSEHGKIVALRDILLNKLNPSVLIFVQSKQRCRELLKALSSIAAKVPIGTISSEKTLAQREETINEFRTGDILVLICTDVMGRGLDFKNVNMVINVDLPTTVISYIHRIGRTGRGGLKGEAITFFTDSDRGNLLPIAQVIHQAGFEIPEYTMKLNSLTREKKMKLRKFGVKREKLANLPLSKAKMFKIMKKRSDLKKEEAATVKATAAKTEKKPKKKTKPDTKTKRVAETVKSDASKPLRKKKKTI